MDYSLLASEVASLEEVKKAKDLEIEKYKKYLNKAKKIIENIGDKPQAEDSLEVCAIMWELTILWLCVSARKNGATLILALPQRRLDIQIFTNNVM